MFVCNVVSIQCQGLHMEDFFYERFLVFCIKIHEYIWLRIYFYHSFIRPWSRLRCTRIISSLERIQVKTYLHTRFHKYWFNRIISHKRSSKHRNFGVNKTEE